ncbi:MAG: hypothetical protein FWC34_10330 [Bacteroidetes bacterium]|nr:hypothetical protein [Bacteroidota bacterium]MCL2303387.1 hypothetical protein [Lentimicrobiaceae bacterium]
MELHELKNTWTVLDEQLKKNETLNKQIIQEMLQKKSSRSLNKLINTSFINLIVWLLGIPISIWGYHLPRFENFLFPKILFVTIFVTAILMVIWSCYQLRNLMKIDFSKSVKDNMRSVNTYAIMLKKEKIAIYFGFAPIYYTLGILSYYELGADFSYWTFLVVAFIVGVAMTYWTYKRIYDTNIQAIKKCLDELNELNEE